MNDPKTLKMYILIHENVPDGFAPTCAAHASLACFAEFENNKMMRDWFSNSFRKVVCRVSEGEFQKAKTFEDCIMLKENNLEDMETVIAFVPRYEWPKAFQYYSLWRPRQDDAK